MAEFAATKFTGRRYPGPALGPLAIVFTVIFIAGLLPVTTVGGTPYFPGPWASAQEIDTFFRLRPGAASLCASLQFGSAIPLGLFTATITSRLIRMAYQQIREIGMGSPARPCHTSGNCRPIRMNTIPFSKN